jgi:hypothetical protein
VAPAWLDALEAMPYRAEPAVAEVRLCDYPVSLGMRQQARTADLMREFQLLALDGKYGPGSGTTPELLVHFAGTMYDVFGAELAAPRSHLERAHTAGRPSTELRFPLSAESTVAILHYARLMEDADAFCAAGLLIYVDADPEVYALRRWSVEEFVRQFHGAEPRPWSAAGGTVGAARS